MTDINRITHVRLRADRLSERNKPLAAAWLPVLAYQQGHATGSPHHEDAYTEAVWLIGRDEYDADGTDLPPKTAVPVGWFTYWMFEQVRFT